jgi:hypothetical protein
MNLKFLAAAATLCFATASQAATIQLINNGSFETGTLAGWTTSGIGGPSEVCGAGAGRDWNVSSNPAATGCEVVGAPLDGSFAAYVMNDGVAGTVYTLSQDFVVPVSLLGAILQWSDSSVSFYDGAARVFQVDVYKGAALLGTVFSKNMPDDEGIIDWDTHSADLSAMLAGEEGQSLTLRFSNSIPETYTGPAGVGLDAVSLTARTADPSGDVPEPGTLALLGLGLLAGAVSRRRHR